MPLFAEPGRVPQDQGPGAEQEEGRPGEPGGSEGVRPLRRRGDLIPLLLGQDRPALMRRPGRKYDTILEKGRPRNVKCLFSPTEGRSCHPELSEGGAFQVSLSQLQVDLYPYHLAAGNRAAWIRYQEGVHATWLANSLAAFQNSLLDALVPGGGGGAKHSPLARAGGGAAAAAAQVSFPEKQSFSGFIVLSHPSFLYL